MLRFSSRFSSRFPTQIGWIEPFRVGGHAPFSPLVECVLNYIKMPSTGALMITGAWGCGKTYFYNHEITEAIKGLGRKSVKVSLFGAESTDVVLNRIKEEYFYGEEEAVPNNDVGSEVKNTWGLGRIGRFFNKHKDVIDDGAQLITDKINPQKIFDIINSFRSIPNDKVVICFDDLERAIRSANTDNLMGMINDLVENHEFKVIVIANEEFMLKTDPKSLQFKEKVVEKSVAYIPDVKAIFKTLVADLDEGAGNNGQFSELMDNATIQKSIDPESDLYVTNKRLKICIQNLRTVKFALNHYHRMYSDYIKDKNELNDNDVRILVYLWLFTLGISIEFKDNKVSFEDKRKLDTYQDLFSFDDLDLGDTCEVDAEHLFSDKKDDEDTQVDKDKMDYNFASAFYNNYIKSYGEQVVYLPEVYSFITSGKECDVDAFKSELSSIIPEAATTNPAVVIMNRMMSDLHDFTDQEFSSALKELYGYSKKGELPDYVAYLNAAYFVQSFSSLVGDSQEKIENGFKRGVDRFTSRVVLTEMLKHRLQFIKGQISSSVVWLYDYAMEKITRKEEIAYQNDVKTLNKEFKTDMQKFVSHFIVNSYQVPEFLSVPILKDLDFDVVEKMMKTIGSKQIGELSMMLRHRFLDTGGEFMSCYAQEVGFVERLLSGLQARDLSEPKLSNTFVLEELFPLINRILTLYKITDVNSGSE